MFQAPDVEALIIEIGDGVFRQRRALGLSTDELAERSGQSTNTIMFIEQKRGEPKLETLIAVLLALGGDAKQISPKLDGLHYNGDKDLKDVVGVNLVYHRVQNLCTRTKLIRESDVTHKTVVSIEELKAKSLRLMTVYKLSCAVGVTLGDLLSVHNWEDKLHVHATQR